MTNLYLRSEISEDKFDRTTTAKTLLDLALYTPTARSVVVGLYGPWGSGKSRFLELMMEEAGNINADKKDKRSIRVITFQPWLYEDREDVGSGLLTRLITNLPNTKKEKGAELASKVFNVFKSTQITAGLPGAASMQVSPGAAFANADDGKYQASVDDLLKEIKKTVVKASKKHRLIIFVDDLDRCRPEQMVRLLEATSLFLDQLPVIAVLAVDREALERAVESRYGERTGGASYVDKIVDIPFTLHPPTENELETRYNVGWSLIDDVNSEAKSVIRGGLARNPRRWERFFNHLYVVLEHQRLAEISSDEKAVIACVLVIATRFPSLYAVARDNPEKLVDYVEQAPSDLDDDQIKHAASQNHIGNYLPYMLNGSPEKAFMSDHSTHLRAILTGVDESSRLTLMRQIGGSA